LIDPPGAATAVDSDPFAGVLAGVAEQLGAVVDVPMFGLDDTRLQARLGGVLAVRARVEELVARLVKEVDDRGPRAGGGVLHSGASAGHAPDVPQSGGRHHCPGPVGQRRHRAGPPGTSAVSRPW
jgi:hypothetical protein